MNSLKYKIVSRIYGNGRGWCFTRSDFLDIASPETVDITLFRLNIKNVIIRVLRGVYCYPKYNKTLGMFLTPNIDNIAIAIARKFNWEIQPTGDVALNLLGLSNQIQGKYVYLSNGPSKQYKSGKNELIFKKTALKNSGFKHRKSSLIFQAVKALGKENTTEETIEMIRKFISTDERQKILKDTEKTTAWVFEIIKKICREK